jgi:microcystin-dependent protein
MDGVDGVDGYANFDNVVPSNSAIADAAATGAAVTAARRDHVHGREDISAMSNSQPPGDETIPANYGAIIPGGLPYVVANGFATTVAAGGVLVLDESGVRERPRYFLQDSAPTVVLEGDIWISPLTNQTLIYDGAIWRSVEGQPGDLKMASYTTATNPIYGWMLCDGTAVNRATYFALFAVIGTTFGVGDGSTTFNIPDFRGRAPVGSGTGTGGGSSGTGAPTGGSALTARTIGAWAGEETHQLTSTEMPSHTHIQNSHVHAPRGTGTQFLQNGTADASPNLQVGGSSFTLGTNTNGATATNQNTGGDGAHNIMLPFQVAHFYIRY